MQNAPGLLFDVGKNDFGIVFLYLFDKFDNDVGAGCINHRNITHAQNQNLGRFVDFAKEMRHLRSAAEKQRSRQPERHNAFFVQNLRQVATAAVFFQNLFVGFYLNLPTHAMHKDNAGHDEADTDGGIEIDQNR